MAGKNLKKIRQDPAVILDAAKTIPNRDAACCPLFTNGLYDWLDPTI